MARKTTERHGNEAFDRHFSQVYGERWPALRAALEAPGRPEAHLEGLVQPYYLDGASVRAAKALDVRQNEHVLDLCAAPGGKSLVLALALQGTGSLVSNDRSPERRLRLKKVLAEHLPVEYQTNIRVTGYDATRWGLYESAIYDKILLDAPCSSERHLLHSPPHLALWSAHRTKTLSQQALAMLCSALEALKPGGTMLYSTCSISPDENQELLVRFSQKRPEAFTILEQSLELPDDREGEGPLFWSRIAKNS